MNTKPLLTIAALFAGTVLTNASIIYTGNGATGFGGPVGLGSLTLSDNGTTITGTITNGSPGSGFNDSLVIYIDSVSGGYSTTSGFTDTLDTGRKAISAFDGSNREIINLGISADYALFLSPQQGSFGGVWQLNGANPYHLYENDLSLTPTGGGSGSASSYTFSLNVADIGLTPNSGATFSFVATYLNGTNAYLSNETYGATTGLVGSPNPGNGGTVDLSGFNTYQIQPVPEPATYGALAGLGLGGVSLASMIRRRKRSIG